MRFESHTALGVRKSSVAACILCVGFFAGPVLAQAVADSSDSLQEIVVTAQRRAEREVDVPISITALSATQLQNAGVDNLTDLTNVAPGIRVEKFGTNIEPSIRGITSTQTSPGAEANVTTTVDGIYMPNQTINAIPLPDVSRVEVLEGPQGTLFGRNATGGAMLVYTRNPEFTPAADLSYTYGRFDSNTVKVFATAPLIDNKLAFSLSGLYEEDGGYQRNLLDDGKLTGTVRYQVARAKLLFEPMDNVKFVLTGVYGDTYDGSIKYYAFDGISIGRNGPGPLATQPYTVASDTNTYYESRYWNTSLRGEIGVGIGTVTTTSSYMKDYVFSGTDGDASPSPLLYYFVHQPDQYMQQEIDLATNKFGPVSVTTGVFFFREEASFAPLDTHYYSYEFITNGTTTAKAWAGFAEANVDLSSDWHAIVGGRYSTESRTVDYTGTPQYDDKSDKFTPRASIRYDFAPRTNVYFTFSQGFKSGVFDLTAASTTAVKPETVTAYELGFKTSQDQYSANFATFYNNYKDLQTEVSSGAIDHLANAGRVESYGVETQGTYKLNRDFSVSAGLQWLHARYTSFTNASVDVPAPGNVGNISVVADVSGEQVIRSPEWTGTLNADYQHSIPYGLVSANLNLFLTDRYPLQIGAPGLQLWQYAYQLLGARVSFEPAGTKFKATVWGKNLTNKEWVQSQLVTTGGDIYSEAPPRTYGVTFDYKF